MKQRRKRLWALGLGLLFASSAWAMSVPEALRALGDLSERGEGSAGTVVRGREGWLFFTTELRSISVGRFWGEAARRVSRAPNPDYADPLPAILDFHRQLQRAGIRLLFVPVPAKVVIYPDRLLDDPPAERLDAAHAEFYGLLRQNGVEVLDLVPVYRAAREGGDPLYCKQDTHWSGRGIELAAEEIVRWIGSPEWLEGVPKQPLESEYRSIRIAGDLWRDLGDPSLPQEELVLRFVGRRTGGGLSPVPPWRESPVLLLGDSHTLVFQAGGDMHAQGAGLADQLAFLLGFPVDLVGVRGSGATPSRLTLYRRRDNLRGKRVVIWCLSVREFTEGQGWRKVPVVQ
ncbi:MAG: hypothetical protein KatS3mg115_1283 [Candidatus Poribacteria bacterium]|nr:MAG: hypothetical protein KatS3mg115_1283 [Candidatus Poribacteria bacterium]